ncbi:MAG TPA: amino acid ABC transporter substrate-binding protein [Dehalococcoidales bacterium]
MKRVLGILLGILLILSLILAGCSSTSSSTTTTTAATSQTTQTTTASSTAAANAPATIKIGAMLSITGADASTGIPTQFIFQYAIDEINKNGGVLVKAFNKKIPLELDLKDNQTDPEKTMAAAEQLNADGCPVVVGTTLAGISASIFEKNKLPLLVNQFDTVALTQQGFKYFFDTSKLNSGTANAIFQLANSLPTGTLPTKWAFFEEQADWIVEMIQYFKDGAAKNGITFSYEGQYQMLAPDFSQLILGAKNSGAEVLVAAPTPPDAINMLKQMQQLNYHPKAIIFFRAGGDPSWADLGALGNYVIGSSEWDPNLVPNDATVQSLVAAWQAKSGKNATISGLGPGYALIQVVAAAIEKAGSLDRTAIRDAIAATDMDTTEGHMKFDANGVRMNPALVVQQWQNGTQYMVWPRDPQYNTKPVIWPIPQ